MLFNPYPNKYRPVPSPIWQYTPISKVLLTAWAFTIGLSLFFLQEIELELSNQAISWNSKVPTLSNQSVIFELSKLKNHLHAQTQWLYEQEYRFGTNVMPQILDCPIEDSPQTDECEIEIPIIPPQHALIIGASSIQSSFGAAISQLLQKKSAIQTTRLGKMGTGLSRADVFDWQNETLELIQNHAIDLIIVQFIGNDYQSIVDKDRNILAKIHSPEWQDTYTQLWRDWIQKCQEKNIPIVILGMPNVRLSIYSRHLQELNSIVSNIATEQGLPFISLWELSTENNRVKESIRRNGRTHKFKHEDGIHFSHIGAQVAAEYVVQELNKIYAWTDFENPSEILKKQE